MLELTKRQIGILKELKNGDVLTAQALASQLHVSTKTIRNDIHAINEVYPDAIEALRPYGFKLINNSILIELQNSVYRNLKDTNVEFDVLKEVLSDSENDIGALSDRLFISDTSLMRIIKKINKRLDNWHFNISIIRKNNQLIFTGNEQEKRKVISFFLTNEFATQTLKISDYQSYFKYEFNLNTLRTKTIQFFKKNKIEIRDVELVSFLLHVSIMMDRIKHKHNIIYKEYQQEDDFYVQLANNYYEVLKEVVDIQLNENEINYLSSLFAGKLNLSQHDDSKNIKLLIDLILKDVNELYGIDFQTDEQLKNSLLVHLVGLKNRIKYNTFLKNPMIEDIKKRFPILFDISVYMADEIQDCFHVHLYEEEISYITLHLMGALERNSETVRKSIVIISPVGQSGVRYFSNKLSHIHHFEIFIKSVLSIHEVDKICLYQPDLVISFEENIEIDKEYPVYYVKNLLNDEDIENIFYLLCNHHKNIKCLDFF